MRLTGPFFCCAIYYLLWRHTEVFLTVIAKVLRKRLGVGFGMVWVAIGVVITFNVVFNHLMCMLIKPGGPTDLAVSASNPHAPRTWKNCATTTKRGGSARTSSLSLALTSLERSRSTTAVKGSKG